jgi:hypothetical protein
MYPSDLIAREADPKDIQYLKGNSFSNMNTLVSIPTRGMIHCKVIISWKSLMYPLNSNISHFFIEGLEVGEARNKTVQALHEIPNLEYLLFLDDDVLVPSDLLIRLSRCMKEEEYDIISGLYHIKDSNRTPLAFRIEDNLLKPISQDEELSGKVIDVDVVPMGCTLIKKSAFSKLIKPYFKTVNESDGIRTTNITEDVYFCRKAKEAGLKIGIHTGLRCGHLDVNTGIIY